MMIKLISAETVRHGAEALSAILHCLSDHNFATLSRFPVQLSNPIICKGQRFNIRYWTSVRNSLQSGNT